MKKAIVLIFTLFLTLCLASCGSNKDNDPVALEAPVISLSGNIVSWEVVTNATGYIVNVDGNDKPQQTETSYTLTGESVGNHNVNVVAVGNNTDYLNSVASNTVTYTVSPAKLTKPTIQLSGNVVSWTAVPNASAYIVTVNGSAQPEQATVSYTITNKTAGDYVVTVVAKGNGTNYTNSDSSNSVTYTVEAQELTATTLYVVGDSTLCGFSDKYYLPRYGYGTQLNQYLDSKVTVNNLALSGRSSRSFLTEPEYATLTANIKQGDYLLIGFGHNDQKAELARYSNPNLAYNDSTTTLPGITNPVSFQYTLYNYYIRVAEEVGATPILCTPIVRISNKDDYTGANGHKTSDATADGITYAGGDYAQAIRDLGQTTSTTVIDLTAITKADYETIGYEAACNYHAYTGTKDGVRSGLDGTHTNIYGAKMNAYHVATELAKTSNQLAGYVKEEILKPTIADMIPNPNYVEPSYEAFNSSMASAIWDVTAEGWYGTVFGDCGGASKISTDVYTVSSNSAGTVFTVGSSTNQGKTGGSTDGLGMIFKQVDVNKNISFSATVTLTKYTTGNNQTGFGVMLRDDIWVDKFDSAILSNYASAGYCVSGSGTSFNATYSRVNGTIAFGKKATKDFAQGDQVEVSITKVNSTVTVTIGDYTTTYYDFDLCAVDENFMYIGMYATRGTIATFTNVNFQITGDSVQA